MATEEVSLEADAAADSPSTGRDDSLPDTSFLDCLRGQRVGDTVHFPAVRVGDEVFTSAVVERDFRTASGAHLLQMYPGGTHYIVKFADVRQEHAMMCALMEMNRRWQEHAVSVCGVPVQALTYRIFPIGSSGGLIEAVPRCQTLRELRRRCREAVQRVVEALKNDPEKLNVLAASTTAYLTACYALGVRDGHDDNIMLREDGSLFRVDFGFVFGATPEIDTPQTVVARAVTYALGDRWLEVVATCGDSLTALTGNSYGSPPAYDCLSSVPELEGYLPLVRAHTASLSLARFCQDVSCADQWSFSRAAKNTLREALQFLRDQAGLGPEPGKVDEEEEEEELPEWIEGAGQPMSDPFLDLNLFLDSGVDLLGLYRTMPEFAEPDGESDWLSGPVADILAMAKEGISREESEASSRRSPVVGHLPFPEEVKEGDPKVRMKNAREMLKKLYATALRNSQPFPVDPRQGPRRPQRYGGYPLAQDWAVAPPILPVQPLPVNDPFAPTPPVTPREPQLLEVLAPVEMGPANTYNVSCGMYSNQMQSHTPILPPRGMSCAGRSPEPLHRVAPLPKMQSRPGRSR